ncbi:PASTA domain-containing protein [candidate division TA06 bacterium]|nr:PASTA domain-containing protein [candidate division TA06 bacterium]
MNGGRYFLVSFFIAIFVSISVSSFFYFILPGLQGRNTFLMGEVEVPNLKGMDKEQADLVLRNKDLLLMAEEWEDPTVPKGQVIRQDPLPGFSVRKGSLVKVVVSKGSSQSILLPDLSGLTLPEARVRLEERGFKVGTQTSKPSVEYPVNTVISSDPLPGSSISPGSLIHLTVSSGSGSVVIPNLSGITLPEARLRLEEKGLVVGSVEKVSSEDISKDHVISTTPGPNARVQKATHVDITVSSGAPLVSVPNVRRMSPNRARGILQDKGLKMDIQYTTSEEYAFGIIIAQRPKSGRKAASGSTVTVTVNTEAR